LLRFIRSVNGRPVLNTQQVTLGEHRDRVLDNIHVRQPPHLARQLGTHRSGDISGRYLILTGLAGGPCHHGFDAGRIKPDDRPAAVAAAVQPVPVHLRVFVLSGY
jgi:hypothetical protein